MTSRIETAGMRRRRGREERQEFIAAYLTKKQNASFGELARELTKAGLINSISRKPWSIGVVHKDVAMLRQEWRDNARTSMADHMARQLVEIAEAKRAAFKDGDMPTVLKAIQTEMKLLGTEAPVTINVNLLTILDAVAIRLGTTADILINHLIMELQESEYAAQAPLIIETSSALIGDGDGV